MDILQEMYCLEGSCKKYIDLQEPYKNCIMLQDPCKKYIFGQILQDLQEMHFCLTKDLFRLGLL